MAPEPTSSARTLIVMGVSGSGKTTVGRLLADRLGWRFLDADDYHPPRNVEKMSTGVPLDDEDRLPWLNRLAALVADSLARGESLVLACSALKRSYRQILRGGDERVSFVYLRGKPDQIRSRMVTRSGHYMPTALLESQLQSLEEPEDALVLDVDLTPDELARRIADSLG